MVAAPFTDMVSVSSMSDLTILIIIDRYIVLSPLSMLAVSALIAPRLQLYTCLMCNDLYEGQRVLTNGGANLDMRSLGSIPCAADPVVQANVAKFLTSLCHLMLRIYVLRDSH